MPPNKAKSKGLGRMAVPSPYEFVQVGVGKVCSAHSSIIVGFLRIFSAERKGPRLTCKDPAGNLRFRTGFGPKAGPNHAQNIRHGTHKPAHNDSERFWADSGVFRRRSETSKR